VKVIHKTSLGYGSGTLCANSGFVPLDVQVQDGSVVLWYEVDSPHVASSSVQYQAVGTGHPFDSEGWQYIATVQTPPNVWHVYIKVPE